MKLKSKKLVCGVGINDVPGFSKTRQGKNWYSVITRAYSEMFKSRQPTYENVTVHPDWLTGSNFKNSNIHDHYVPGYCLDKDILVPGNKEYSEAACRYVPQYVNNLLLDRGNDRGLLPVGVTRHGKGFQAHCSQLQQNDKSKKVSLGTFSTPELAHREWQRGKIKAIVLVIEKYKTEPMPLREIIAALKLRIRKLKNDIRKKRITIKL
ncbi:hypothetical protein GNG27_08700 [Leclercia sp. 119287]|uniref:hypothetical protein n=1 Tax=Leclercia sp. 119287 TaxID=2681308 RepID=UPI0012E2B4D5|nr:hypothetical protein [Leclercia sp. 119287]QGU14732.1 hypothetical protein GNG27_08700 [Leclercia sp. 119287]